MNGTERLIDDRMTAEEWAAQRRAAMSLPRACAISLSPQIEGALLIAATEVVRAGHVLKDARRAYAIAQANLDQVSKQITRPAT